MSVLYKEFSTGEFKRADAVTRDAALRYLGHGWIENPDKFGPDLYNPELNIYCEVEVRWAWKSGEWPYTDVQMAKRKERYCLPESPYFDKELTYLIYRADLEACVAIRKNTLTKNLNKTITKDTRLTSNETLFSLPKASTRTIYMNPLEALFNRGAK